MQLSLVYDRHHQYQMTGTSNAVGVVNVSLQQPRRPNLIQGDWQPPTQGFQLGTGKGLRELTHLHLWGDTLFPCVSIVCLFLLSINGSDHSVSFLLFNCDVLNVK